ncbi:MAG: chemotaxis protein CheX [Treponema sp.]|nr:chemotaxis protein CheX [Treponema sp.]
MRITLELNEALVDEAVKWTGINNKVIVINEALKKYVQRSKQTKYINIFLKVCTSVFKDLTKCTIQPEKTYFADKKEFQNWDITGVVLTSGDTKGLIGISMKTGTAAKITHLLTGKMYNSIDDDVVDVIGEVINIITGQIKRELEKFYLLSTTMPMVIRGNEHRIVLPYIEAKMLCVLFKIFETETISVTMAIDKHIYSR